MSYSVISVLCGIVIVAIGAGALYIGFRRSQENKEKAKEFIDGLGEKMLNLAVEIIKDFKSEDFKELDEFEIAVLNKIYSESFKYVKQEAEKAFEKDILAKAILNAIDEDDVIDAINKIIEKQNLNDLMVGTFDKNHIDPESIEKNDAELVEKFSNQEDYVENVEDVEIEEAKPIVPTEDEIKELNPPKEDEDENVDIEDDSVEVIVDKKEIISVKDKNGKERYYEIDEKGKKKQVSKAYALEQLKK